MVRTQTDKYIAYSEGDHNEQLFDLASDPGETENLARNPDSTSLLNSHRALLAQACEETNDAWIR